MSTDRQVYPSGPLDQNTLLLTLAHDFLFVWNPVPVNCMSGGFLLFLQDAVQTLQFRLASLFVLSPPLPNSFPPSHGVWHIAKLTPSTS